MRVRHDFYATLLDLFIDNWAKPYYEYCAANKLVFTGHYWEHEWPRPVVNPDNLAFAAYAHMPGIDILMNDFQTGHPRPVRQRPGGQGDPERGQPVRARSGRCPKPSAPAAGT